MNKRLLKAKEEHERWLFARGLTDQQLAQKKKASKIPRETIIRFKDDRGLPPTSDKVGNGFKTTMMSKIHLEPKGVQEEIIRKAKCLAPPYSKGAYQYVTPNSNPEDLGKKK